MYRFLLRNFILWIISYEKYIMLINLNIFIIKGNKIVIK